MKKEINVKRGRKSREAGARFERKVRADLEDKGWIHSQEENVPFGEAKWIVDRWSNHFGEAKWIVDRWSNQVEFSNEGSDKIKGMRNPDGSLYGKLVKAKSFMGRSRSNGFPDFVCFKELSCNIYEVIGVEVKSNGKLSKIEKEKCEWLLKNKIFGKIFVAEKNGSLVNYKEIHTQGVGQE